MTYIKQTVNDFAENGFVQLLGRIHSAAVEFSNMAKLKLNEEQLAIMLVHDITLS